MLWKKRLELARIHLDFAVESLNELEEEQRAGRPLPADSSILLEFATRAVHKLRRDYLRIAGTYLDLVENGKIPLEEPSRKSDTGLLAEAEAIRGNAATREPENIILIVDDDTSVRDLVQAILEQASYSCLTAANGENAMAILRDDSRGIRMVISDVNMPGMSGLDLARQIIEERPGIRVLLTSGNESPEIDAKLPFLKKPFTPQGLWRKVEQVLSGPVARTATTSR